VTSAQLAPAILVPLVAWRIYLRAQRKKPRQQFHRGRLVARFVLGTLLTALVMTLACPHLPSFESGLGGLLVGGLVGLAGLRLTRWEMTPEGDFYTPNAFLSVGLILVLTGRLVYRATIWLSDPHLTTGVTAALMRCPFTLGLFGLTAGYYLAYTAGVLARGRKLL
jgi:hypothetical protein